MKVLIGMTRSDTTLSGSYTHIRQMGEAFRAQGTEVVYVLGGDGIANEKLRHAGFRVLALPLLKRQLHPVLDMVVLLQLIWLILRERPTICSWHTAKIGALGRIASWLTGRRSYYVAHGVPFVNTPENKGHKIYERLEKLLAWLPSKIICVCSFDHSEYRRIGVRPNRLMTIPNGMGSAAADAGDAPDRAAKVRFVTAARFEAQKDYATLAAACKQLAAQGDSYELHIYGNGPLEAEVRKMFEGLPPGVVAFHGVVDNFAHALQRYDVFALCSHWEGLPRSIIEAMAGAKPVIASNVGGVSELICPGVNGYLVTAKDTEGFADAMQRYIRQPGLIAVHGRAGLDRYRADYTLDAMLNRYCAEYLGAVPA